MGPVGLGPRATKMRLASHTHLNNMEIVPSVNNLKALSHSLINETKRSRYESPALVDNIIIRII